ncbi:MAG: DUF5946 family protein [Thermoanaerobaculia bacterium]|nr:DUF5946 family protein [Thermoanaerobaculia bacterium]
MTPEVVCPGCGLGRPKSDTAVYDGYFHTSPECWSVFETVIGREFQNGVLFGAVHQLTVDAYAVQHAGGPHPDKSVGVHLSGLHLALVQGIAPVKVAPLIQRIASRKPRWPHFEPPEDRGRLTVLVVAQTADPARHAERAKAWAAAVWAAWAPVHADVAAFVERHLERRLSPA